MRYPPMPKRIGAPGGPIIVRLVKREKTNDGDPAWGSWEPHTRTIRIERGAPVAHRWKTFWHEFCHAMLDDNGISEILSQQGEEAMCKAMSSGMMALGVFPPKG